MKTTGRSGLKLSESGTSVLIQLAAKLQNARVREAMKEYRQAKQTAQLTVAEAGRLGFVGFQLEASLALGEVQIRYGNQAAGRARLAKLKQDADGKGFGLLAKKAFAASASNLSR